MLAVYISLALLVCVNANNAQPTPKPTPCTPSPSTGCLNGHPFDRDTQYVCGTMIVSNKTRCCGSGAAYDPASSFCCGPDVKPFATDECELFGPIEKPAAPQILKQSFLKHKDDSDNFLQPGSVCRNGNETYGCYDGRLFNFKTEYICYGNIVKYDIFGCCPTGHQTGKPYLWATQSCCLIEGKKQEILPTYGACEAVPKTD